MEMEAGPEMGAPVEEAPPQDQSAFGWAMEDQQQVEAGQDQAYLPPANETAMQEPEMDVDPTQEIAEEEEEELFTW